MPSSRVYEGELNGLMVLLVMLKKLDEKVCEYGSMIAILSRDVREVQSRILPVHSLQQQPQSRATCQQQQAAGSRLPVCSEIPSTTEFPTLLQSMTTTQSADQAATERNSHWVSQTSTPIVHHNKFAPLSADDDDEQSDAAVNEAPFSLVVSRKTGRKKRIRDQVSPQPTPNTRSDTAAAPRRAFGKSRIMASKLVAAKPMYKKSVLCIDNLSSFCTVDDISAYVRKELATHVISCFEVKPRRRRYEESADDRKAFRLCIRQDDRNRLLDPALWPDSVMVSDWFFKSQSEGDKRQRLDTRQNTTVISSRSASVSHTATAVLQDTAAAAAVTTGPDELVEMSSDETILTACVDCPDDGGSQ